MRIILLVSFFILSTMVGAQTVSGIVYDSESTVKGARLYNETQNKLNYTKGDGRFELEATLGDVLIIYSLFHQKLRVTVTPEFYEDVVVFELKQITNALDEVEVHKVIERKYDSTAFQNDLSIPARAPKTPVLRSGSNYEPTLNLISLASAIGRLFKRKKIDVPTIKAADFEKLFETDSFFTIDFLRKDLQIEEKEEYLFFEYCANQKLAPALLNNQLLMVEALLKCSANFRIAKESPNTN